jgi:hypothetical protein
VPLPFQCVYVVQVADYHQVEKLLHDAFADTRARSSREFFEIDEQRVISALMLASGKDVTPGKDVTEDVESSRALKTANERRRRFKFSMVGLKPGDEINYLKLDNTTATVASDTSIIFGGQEVSIYKATMALLKRQDIVWKSVQGQQYWEYVGETLSQRRRRMEADRGCLWQGAHAINQRLNPPLAFADKPPITAK